MNAYVERLTDVDSEVRVAGAYFRKFCLGRNRDVVSELAARLSHQSGRARPPGILVVHAALGQEQAALRLGGIWDRRLAP